MLRVRTTLDGWSGGPGLQTFYFTGGTEDAAAALTCVTAVHAFWTDFGRSLLWNSTSIQVQGNVDLLTAASGAITDTFSVTQPGVVMGNGGADLEPPAVAALVHLKTGNFVAGRRVQGKIYLSPLARQVVTTGGLLDATYSGTATDGIDAMAVDVASLGSVVVWHRPKSGSGGLACPITASDTASKLAVLTSRRD